MTPPQGHVFDRLNALCQERGSWVCVGLDPHLDQIPAALRAAADPVGACRRFLFDIMDAVADVVAVVKPQIAFFEQLGPEGIALYFDCIRFAHQRGLMVIGDIKRADIGSTAAAYARAHLGPTDGSAADIVTLNPYLGRDGIEPFLKVGRPLGRGAFVLVRTSNPTAADFQSLESGGVPLYEHVGRALERWGADHRGAAGFSDLGAVVGATAPAEAAALRRALPATFFLVPGYGAQGGTARDVARTFRDRRDGAVVNSSRGILFACQGEQTADYATAARTAAMKMSSSLQQALAPPDESSAAHP